MTADDELKKAILSGNAERARQALERGANANALFGTSGSAVLHYAVGYGNTAVVEALLGKEANPNRRDADQGTPLHWAATDGRPEIGSLLLRAGAETDARTAKQNTPLHRAASHGRDDFARLLLDHGADPNAQNADDVTPLHSALISERPATARLLVERGAEIHVQDNQGRTPMLLAHLLKCRRDGGKMEGLAELIDLLATKQAAAAQIADQTPTAEPATFTERHQPARRRPRRRER